MSLSSDIARGNTERLAGRKRISESTRQIIPLRAGLLLEQHGPIYKTTPGDASPSSGA